MEQENLLGAGESEGVRHDFCFRYATADDAEVIAAHRAAMFADNQFASSEVLEAMRQASLPWLRERLTKGTYLGLLAEEDHRVVAGAGLFFADFPPHWRHLEPVRPYILNVYTDPAYRGHGLAKAMMQRLVHECEKRGHVLASLHASPQGRPIYRRMGFVESDEMLLPLPVRDES